MRRLALGNLLYLCRYYFGPPHPQGPFRAFVFKDFITKHWLRQFANTGPQLLIAVVRTAVYRNCHSLPHAASWRRPPTTASTLRSADLRYLSTITPHLISTSTRRCLISARRIQSRLMFSRNDGPVEI